MSDIPFQRYVLYARPRISYVIIIFVPPSIIRVVRENGTFVLCIYTYIFSSLYVVTFRDYVGIRRSTPTFIDIQISLNEKKNRFIIRVS